MSWEGPEEGERPPFEDDILVRSRGMNEEGVVTEGVDQADR